MMAATIIIFIGLVSGGILAWFHVEAGTTPSDYYPKSSYYYKYLDASLKDFGGEPEATSIVIQKTIDSTAISSLKERHALRVRVRVSAFCFLVSEPHPPTLSTCRPLSPQQGALSSSTTPSPPMEILE